MFLPHIFPDGLSPGLDEADGAADNGCDVLCSSCASAFKFILVAAGDDVLLLLLLVVVVIASIFITFLRLNNYTKKKYSNKNLQQIYQQQPN